MQNYSIMPLDEEHIDEVCADIIEQYESGTASCALLMVKLVPEGDPPIDKARAAAKAYNKFRDKLNSTGHDAGILAQCTLGHGYPLDEPFKFQNVVNFNDGQNVVVACPMDKGVRAYLRGAFKTLAECRPKTIMIDDDFRLLFRPGVGCGCPLHMAEFNKRAGTSLTRAELFDIIETPRDARAAELKRIFLSVQNDSLYEAAREIRAGVDEVEKTLPMTVCGCQYDYCGEIARIIAGEGNPPTLRINNGNYTPEGARYLSDVLFRAALPIGLDYNKGITVLAETDTCPQNRYSTGAQSLHSHFTVSILAGVQGAKHWITRLSSHEPASGVAYRKILAKHRGFYEVLSELAPKIDWQGAGLPLPRNIEFNFAQNGGAVYNSLNTNGWGLCVLERLGIPMYFSSKPSGAVFVDNSDTDSFTDEEIRAWFSGSVFLSSGAAEKLTARGFGEYIGASVGDAPKENTSGEIIHANGNRVNAQQRVRELKIVSEGAYADSTVYHLDGGTVKRPMFPGTVVLPRKGGITATFSGTPRARFLYTEAFSFLNESRKLQLVKLLKSSGNLPVYYTEDGEVMLMAGRTPEGELFIAVFNIGFDPLEELPLAFEKAPSVIEMLTPSGERRALDFETKGGVTRVKASAVTLNPVVLFVK